MNSNDQIDGETEMQFAKVCLQKGDYAVAITRYVNAIRAGLSQADTAEAHYSLGVAYVGLRKRESALEEYRMLKELDEQLAKELHRLIGEIDKGRSRDQ